MAHSPWFLTALLLIPLGGAAAVAALRRTPTRAWWATIAALTAELGLALAVAALYTGRLFTSACPPGDTCGHATIQTTFDFAQRTVLAGSFGLAYDVGVDGISIFLVVLTALVTWLAVLGARERDREPAFLGWLLLLTTATMGAFITRDLLDFFLFFELTLVPAYFMIAGWGGPQRARAAIKFFIYTLVGSSTLFVGILYLAFAHQHRSHGALTFSYTVLANSPLTHGAAVWVFVGFAIAFAVKSPLFPLHTWSPLAYAEAPTAGSMVLAALLAKLGTYGLLRFAVLLLPSALHAVQPYLLTIAVVTILYASVLAAAATDLKRLVAYSSMAQVGFITLGVVSGSKIATAGAVLLMFNHGVIVAGLFLIVGFIGRRRGTTQVSALAGLQRPAPVLAGAFTVVMLASIGLPGLSGFVSEFLVLLGTFGTHRWWAVVAAGGVILAALYLLWAYQRVFQGTATGENAEIADARTWERWVLVPVIVAVLALGIYPRYALDRIDATVHHSTVASTTTGAQP